MERFLRLDEALIQLKSTGLSNETLDIYQRLNECFRCPTSKLESLVPSIANNFIVQTKHSFLLEIWKSNSKLKLCELPDLELMSQGHYELGLNLNDNNCTLNLVHGGECKLCPIAVVVCIILLITLLEKLLGMLVKSHKQRRNHKQPKTEGFQEQASPVTASVSEQEDEALGRLDEVIAQSEGRTLVKRKSERVEALDVFRGFTIAAMIMVNNGGAGYTMLEHKVWDGISLADFVFPFFIFSMGASIALSSRSKSNQKEPLSMKLYQLLRRSFILFALGICLNSRWLDDRDFHYLRVTGVLQRFAVSFLVVALARLIETALSEWINAQGLCRVPWLSHIFGSLLELLIAVNCIALYIYATFYFTYDTACPVGYLGPGGQTDNGAYFNCTGGAAGWIDRELLGTNHLYNNRGLEKVFGARLTLDPEGLLGCTMSILLTLVGLQAGKIIINHSDNRTRLILFLASSVVLAFSSLLVVAIPINKHLWSLTFVTSTGCIAYLVLSLFFILLDVCRCTKIFMIRLLISAGKNSILLYVGHSIFTNMLPWYFKVDDFSRFQLFLRLCWTTFVWLLVAHYLALKGIFLKI